MPVAVAAAEDRALIHYTAFAHAVFLDVGDKLLECPALDSRKRWSERASSEIAISHPGWLAAWASPR
jgi:hypothetical protein